MKDGKVWGETQPVLSTPFVEIHKIDAEPHRRCSWHRHKHKWNLFWCLRGQLTILVEKADYALVDETVLHAGESTTVAPGQWHTFVTGTVGAEALEVYYPEALSSDIERRDCGGKVEDKS